MTASLNPDLLNTQNDFINFKGYLDDIFLKNSIRLKCPKEKLEEMKKKYLHSFVVTAEDFLEGNLRMIDTYLPELLFYLAINNKCNDSIERIIRNSNFEESYLRYKLHKLFEVIMFSDFFDNVFKGEFNMYRCFALKQKELKYFRLYDSFSFFNEVAGNLYLTSNHYSRKEDVIVEMRMIYKQKPS